MTTIHDATVELDLIGAIPRRLGYDQRDWTIIDTPTPLGIPEEAVYSGYITHPPYPWVGWRFWARADDGDVLGFDVRQRGGEWDVIRVYR